MDTGKAIKIALIKREKNQGWLANKMGVHPQVISRWCTNKVPMKVPTLEEIARNLDYSLREMIEFSEQ